MVRLHLLLDIMLEINYTYVYFKKCAITASELLSDTPHMDAPPNKLTNCTRSSQSKNLLEDEAFLSKLLAASTDCIKVLDLDANILAMNENGQKALELIELTPHLGTCWTGWWHGPTREIAEAAVATAKAGGTGRFEAGAKTFGGTEKWWDITVTAIPGPDGEPERLLSVSRDISEQHKLRDEAAERLDRLRSIIESVRDYAVINITPEGMIEGWSSGAETTFQWKESDILGHPFSQIWTEEDKARGSPQKELNLAESAGVAPDNRWHVKADGQRIFVVGNCRPVRNAEKTLTGFVKICRDETENKQAQIERQSLFESEQNARVVAEQAGRMKDEFLATLSHELRTPLNSIIGWIQIIKRKGYKAEEVETGLGIIDRNARAQAQIIEDILDMSRIISGKLHLNLQKVDLIQLVQAGIDTIKPAADLKDIHLEIVLDPDAATSVGDPQRLHQIFWNLLSNAVKFTPKGGRVEVRLERKNSRTEVHISDTGQGIEPAFLPNVFDRFRQGDASTTRQHGGLGIGLSIVKQLVELHGGTASVTSLGKGQGSTFSVILPISVTHIENILDDADTEPQKTGFAESQSLFDDEQLKGLKVLVVDDEKESCAVIKRLLEDSGAVVRTANSAKDALETMAKDLPDILLSDIGMPDQDGYSLIKRVRELSPEAGGHIPAGAITAYARDVDVVKTVEAGFNVHISKPVEPLELIRTVLALSKQK